MKLIFFGTPEFSLPSLKTLANSPHNLVMVVTQPDKLLSKRGKRFSVNPVKNLAQAMNLPVLQPQKLEEAKQIFEDIRPDAAVVVAYGKLLPSWLLTLPEYGCINLHPSELPKYRGPAPIQRAVLEGEKETAVSTMVLDEGVDDGPVLMQKKVPINVEDDYGSLSQKLAVIGADLVLETLNGLESGNLKPRPQEENKVTFAPKLEKKETYIDWSGDAVKIRNLVRALSPSPGAYTILGDKRLKILDCHVAQELERAEHPGRIISVLPDRILVSTGSVPLEVTQVQLEGRNSMGIETFLRGHSLRAGTILA